jgi:hypothetical protein
MFAFAAGMLAGFGKPAESRESRSSVGHVASRVYAPMESEPNAKRVDRQLDDRHIRVLFVCASAGTAMRFTLPPASAGVIHHVCTC